MKVGVLVMSLETLINLLKKKGFRDTYNILVKYKNYSVDLNTFYRELNKFSYYNSFLRIKKKLIERDLIDIKKLKGKKRISLTKKGIEVFKKLKELDSIINEKM